MQTNDYAKWGGYEIKVISGEPYNYTVYILERGKIRENVSCYHISLLIKGVLEACGFTKVGNTYSYTKDDANIEIKYTSKIFNRECKLSWWKDGARFEEKMHTSMLGDLQGFIRKHLQIELPIQEEQLIKVVKRNELL